MTKASVQMPKTLTYCYEIAVAGFIKCSTIKRLITSHLSFARIGAGLEGKKNLSFYLVSCCFFVLSSYSLTLAGAPNDGSLQNTLRTLFRLSRVFLDL